MKGKVYRNVVWMGLVSLLADVAGEMIAPLLPLFLTITLEAPASVVGLVDGSAELAASLFRAVGGWWSDRSGRRKPTVVFGYGLSALAKPLLSAAGSWPTALFSRVLDRTGKGLRGSARDALIAASVSKEDWGKAFGLHRAMDTAGAVAGPLVALALMSGAGFSYRAVFAAASVPALASVLVLFFFVKEAHEVSPVAAAAPAPVPAVRPPLPRSFWVFLSIYGLFALGNSSDSFILLKARHVGMAPGRVILAYVLFNLVNASLAPSLGRLADRVGRRRMVAAGLAVFALCYAGFARVSGPGPIWPLFALYGLHAALVEGSFRAVVSEFSVEGNRGTAHGVFQSVSGALAFTASVTAGFLWTKIGPAAPFWFGAACAALSSAALFSAARTATTNRA